MEWIQFSSEINRLFYSSDHDYEAFASVPWKRNIENHLLLFVDSTVNVKCYTYYCLVKKNKMSYIIGMFRVFESSTYACWCHHIQRWQFITRAHSFEYNVTLVEYKRKKKRMNSYLQNGWLAIELYMKYCTFYFHFDSFTLNRYEMYLLPIIFFYLFSIVNFRKNFSSTLFELRLFLLKHFAVVIFLLVSLYFD